MQIIYIPAGKENGDVEIQHSSFELGDMMQVNDILVEKGNTSLHVIGSLETTPLYILGEGMENTSDSIKMSLHDINFNEA